MHVVSRVVGFKKIRFQTNENVGSGELDLPEQQMHTTSYWLEIPLSIVNALPYATDDRRDGVIGLAFAMKQVAQLLLMCDARDVGLSVNAGRDADGERGDTPRIFIYDAYPGGIGFSAPLWGMQRELLSQTSALIAELRLRNRLPDVRRPDRRDRSAGEDSCVAHARASAGGSTAGGSRRRPPKPREEEVPF